jgi:hypothetical protein
MPVTVSRLAASAVIINFFTGPPIHADGVRLIEITDAFAPLASASPLRRPRCSHESNARVNHRLTHGSPLTGVKPRLRFTLTIPLSRRREPRDGATPPCASQQKRAGGSPRLIRHASVRHSPPDRLGQRRSRQGDCVRAAGRARCAHRRPGLRTAKRKRTAGGPRAGTRDRRTRGGARRTRSPCGGSAPGGGARAHRHPAQRARGERQRCAFRSGSPGRRGAATRAGTDARSGAVAQASRAPDPIVEPAS